MRSKPAALAASRHAWLLWAVLALLPWPHAWAQELDFRPPASTADPALLNTMRDLAYRLLPVYQDNDTERYLNNLAALQMVTGNWPSAWQQRQALMERRNGTSPNAERPFDLYARARVLEHEQGINFGQAWTRIFKLTVPRLPDPDALELDRLLMTPVYQYRNELQQQLDHYRGQSRINVDSGLRLIHAWLAFDAWRAFSPVVPTLVADDQNSRYQQADVQVQLPKQHPMTAHLILPSGAPEHLPAQLIFRPPGGPAVDEEDDLALAAHGSAVVILQAAAPPAVPPKHRRALKQRAAFFSALTRWIAHQPWSNGHVDFPSETNPVSLTPPPPGKAPPAVVIPHAARKHVTAKPKPTAPDSTPTATSASAPAPSSAPASSGAPASAPQ